jgi:hypothetical protein
MQHLNGSVKTEDSDRTFRISAMEASPERKGAPEAKPKQPQPAKNKVKVGNADQPWPKPKPLGGLPAVEKLTPELIPECFREHSTDVAERMQVALDFAFAAQVVATGAAIGRRVQVQPKAYDTPYRITPNLWGALVGISGAKKSPVLYLITEPLRLFEADWQRSFEVAMKEYEAAKERRKNGDSEGEPPEKPKRRRLLENDASYDKVQVDMAENPAGIFLCRDEISGWLGMLDRP